MSLFGINAGQGITGGDCVEIRMFSPSGSIPHTALQFVFHFRLIASQAIKPK
jgi:hypothetical protein